MVLSLLLLAASAVRAQDGAVTCPCTNNNEVIPDDHLTHGTDYGTSCRDWDNTQDYCDPDNAAFQSGNEAWCPESWCYVDKSCIVVVGSDVFRPVPTIIFEGLGIELFYSYETCGSPDHYNGAWNFTFSYPQKCSCTGSNEGNPQIEGTDVGKWCDDWDMDNDYCDPSNKNFLPGNEKWCPNDWCYVQKGCVAELNGRNWTSSETVYNDSAELYWSYETCGYHNFFAGEWTWGFQKCSERPPLDVYLLVDSSGSVWNEWDLIQEASRTMVGFFNASFGDRVSLILFGGTKNDLTDNDFFTVSKLTNNLGKVADKAKVMEKLRPNKKTKGGTPHTWTYGAINYTFAEMDKANPKPDNEPLLIIVTDGRPNPVAEQHPCDPNINHAHPRSEIDERGMRVLVFEVRRTILELDCLVENPATDVFHVPDPANFFDGITEEFFCVHRRTPAPTSLPTCPVVEAPPNCQAGPNTYFDVNDVCQVDLGKTGDSCGLGKSRIKKSKKNGSQVRMDDACSCEVFCKLDPKNRWWLHSKDGKCQCYETEKGVIQPGDHHVGKIIVQ